MYGVTIKELIKKMDLKNMTPELDTEKTVLVHPDVNRPALQLTGFFDHFDKERVQIIGYVEQAYLNTLTLDRRRYIYDKLISSKIPCLLYSRGLEPDGVPGGGQAAEARTGDPARASEDGADDRIPSAQTSAAAADRNATPCGGG